MTFEWVDLPKHRGGQTRIGMKLGSVIVAEVTYYNVDWRPPEPRPYTVSIDLPQVKIWHRSYLTQDDAKARAERLVKKWLKDAGLKQ